MPGIVPPGEERVRTAEVIATLSLATDLGIGVALEHGLESTLFAMRLCERLGTDSETAQQAYYTCLLFYVGCTAGAELAADVFGEDDPLTTFGTPVRFGARPEMMRGMLRAVAPPDGSVATRIVVLDAAGQAVPKIERPAGLTDREAQVIGLLARGRQTKQVAAALGISVKTADRHVQNAYAKIGVSTRAGASCSRSSTGCSHGGELPIPRSPGRS